MIQLSFWIVWLIVLAFLARRSSQKVLLSPQVGFIVCFLPQAIYALLYVNLWELELSDNTLFVLCGGTATFLAISYITSRIISHRISYLSVRKVQHPDNVNERIHVDNWKVLLVLFVQVYIFIALVFYINTLNGASFREKIEYYNYITKFVPNGLEDQGQAMPKPLLYARDFSVFYGYIALYLLLHSAAHHYRSHRFIYIVCICISLLSGIIIGSRFDVVALIISAIVQAYFIYGKRNGWKIHISRKYFLYALIGGIALIIGFQYFGTLIGRTTSGSLGDYIAIYLSAQLKNLDTFIRHGKFGCDISNWQTVYSVINFIGKHLGIDEWVHFYDQPFYSINGFSLGNVSTVFYWFMHDGGFIALFIFTTFMAVISQIVFNKALTSSAVGQIDLCVIMYSYMFYGLVFSFFSNRFYSAIISTGFIKFILVLVCTKFLFSRVCFRNYNMQ